MNLTSLAVGGIDMNLDQFITEIQRIELPSGGGAGIPIDRISLRSSRFTSRWGTVEVQEIGANLQGANMKVEAVGAVNGVPVQGTADFDLQGIRRATKKTLALAKDYTTGKVDSLGGILSRITPAAAVSGNV